jgi:hypothetical protein
LIPAAVQATQIFVRGRNFEKWSRIPNQHNGGEGGRRQGGGAKHDHATRKTILRA